MDLEEALGLPRRIFQHCLTRKRIGHHVRAHHVCHGDDLRRRRDGIGIESVDRRYVLENRGKLILQPGYLGVSQAEPRQRGHVFNFFSSQPHDLESDTRSQPGMATSDAEADNRQSLAWPLSNEITRVDRDRQLAARADGMSVVDWPGREPAECPAACISSPGTLGDSRRRRLRIAPSVANAMVTRLLRSDGPAQLLDWCL